MIIVTRIAVTWWHVVNLEKFRFVVSASVRPKKAFRKFFVDTCLWAIKISLLLTRIVCQPFSKTYENKKLRTIATKMVFLREALLLFLWLQPQSNLLAAQAMQGSWSWIPFCLSVNTFDGGERKTSFRRIVPTLHKRVVDLFPAKCNLKDRFSGLGEMFFVVPSKSGEYFIEALDLDLY